MARHFNIRPIDRLRFVYRCRAGRLGRCSAFHCRDCNWRKSAKMAQGYITCIIRIIDKKQTKAFLQAVSKEGFERDLHDCRLIAYAQLARKSSRDQRLVWFEVAGSALPYAFERFPRTWMRTWLPCCSLGRPERASEKRRSKCSR